MRLPRPFKGLLFFHRVKQPLRSAVWRIGNFLATWRDRSSDRGLNFTKGDILVLLDSSWHVPIWPGVIRAKQQGARVGVVLYDLVPLLMPDCCVPELVSAFNEWLGQAVRHADFFVCISRTVAEEAREQLTRRYGEIRSRRPAFGSFRLGADLDLAETRDKVRPALRAAFEQPQFRRVYITVGTVEPRKNHAYLLDAFERTWARGSDASLCIAGKEGWKCAAVLQRIRTHVELGRRLFMFHDLSDGELTYCYRHAGAVILPSKAEGFGLPVVEALRLGCRVWVSDLPIFHEVGGDFCCYFDLGSPDALARLLATDVDGSLASLVRSPAHFRWPDWRESCAELLERVRELAG
jgi:alpha-1,2-rhamnosyltransferase